ncbi:hypothetical protein KEJ39_04035 [Candidatus Bathyarchaeota archaeon]|nr:hypothetical protein [Candidatus Bathyarchaeota archaeon]
MRLERLRQYLSAPDRRSLDAALVLVLLLAASSGMIETSAAATKQITISIQGLPSVFSTRVYVNGSFITSVSSGGSFTVDFDNSATVSVQKYVPETYYNYAWTPAGSSAGGGVAFYTPTSSKTFTSSGSYTFTYYTLYYLHVLSEYGNPVGSGWQIAGSWAPLIVEDIWDSGTTLRHRFEEWRGGPLRGSPDNPENAVFMDSPKIVEAVWRDQYYLRVESDMGNPSGGGWYDSGSKATLSVKTPYDAGNGVRYVFSRWSGDHSDESSTTTLTVNSPMRVIAEWRRQYYLSINPNYGEVSPASGWYDEDSQVIVSAVTPSGETSGSRLVFSHWRGALSTSEPTESLLMDAPKEIHAEWSRQYLLTVQTQFGKGVGGGWYDADSTADFSVESQTVPAGILGWFGVDYVFSHWTGDSSSHSSQASIIMHGPRTIAAVWTLSLTRLYLFTVIICAVAAVAFWKRLELAHTARSATSMIRRSRHGSPD